MGKTLYIHIGNHKTGTTSLQDALAASEAALAARGVIYHYHELMDGPRTMRNVHGWIALLKYPGKSAHLADPDHVARVFARYAGHKGDVIVSSENFSFFYDYGAIWQLKQAAAPYFERIKIVVYIRRQDLHAVSHKREGSNPNRPPEHPLWGQALDPLPTYGRQMDLYLDYNFRLGRWADVFGDDALMIRIYDRKKLRGGDISTDFFAALKLGKPALKPRENASKSAVEAMLGHAINSGDFDQKERLFRALSDADLPALERAVAPARAAAFYKRFAASNTALNARFGVDPKTPDIFGPPDRSAKAPRFAWSDESVTEMLHVLLKALERQMGK